MNRKEYIQNYVKHDVAYLKAHNLRLAELTDKQVKELYEIYSHEYCAGWLTLTKGGVDDFVKWVFVSPFDAYMKEQNDR